jgi:galactokinase
VPCGILDQAVSGFGEAGRLVHIDCAEEKIATVDGPAESRLWIFESGQKHSLVDSLYSERHRECGEALAVLRERDPGLRWLAHADPGSLGYVRERAGDTVYRRARHIVEENLRVRDCVAKLAAGDLAGVGRLLLESHRSSSTLFENSIAELDTLVELLDGREAVRGARLTGGGFGGAVMALCGDGFTEESAAAVAAGFAERHGAEPTFRRLEIADGAGEERS